MTDKIEKLKVGRPKKGTSLSNAERQARYRAKKRGDCLPLPCSPGRPIRARRISEIDYLYYVLQDSNYGFKPRSIPFLTASEAQREADRLTDDLSKFVVGKTVFFLPVSVAFYKSLADFEEGIVISHGD